MDEGMSDDSNLSDVNSSPDENPKRFKTDNNCAEKSNEESSNSTNSNLELAGTSSSSNNFKKVLQQRYTNDVLENEKRNNSKYVFPTTLRTVQGDGEPVSSSSNSCKFINSLRNRVGDMIDDFSVTPLQNNQETESSRSTRPATSNMEEWNDDFNVEQASNQTNSTSDSTILRETDTESEEEDPPALKKKKPKHSWFVVPEVIHRQVGFSSKFQSSDLFQRRCYGSLHSVQRLELMYKLEEHDGCVNSLNFHPNGSLLASGSDDLKVVIWDWKFGKCLLKFDTKHRGNVFQSKFMNLSGDLHIATCARDGQVRLARVSAEEGLRETRKLGSHRGPCHKLAVLSDQPHILLSAGEDSFVFRHDIRAVRPERLVTVTEDEREVALYSIHVNPIRTNEFCVSGRDDVVRVYDQRKNSALLAHYHPFPKDSNPSYQALLHVTCAVYNHDGSQILASYNDADIFLFDVNQPPGNFVHQYQGHRNGATIKGVNFFGPKSEFIVSGSDCGNVYFWEKNTEAIVQWMLADDNGVVNCLEPHPQLPFICTSGLDWDVKVWVPSCEHEPEMKELAETVRSNISKINLCSSTPTDINESQMLWMLWRHLRRSSRARRLTSSNSDELINTEVISNSTSSDSFNSNSDFTNESDGELDGPTGCSTS